MNVPKKIADRIAQIEATLSDVKQLETELSILRFACAAFLKPRGGRPRKAVPHTEVLKPKRGRPRRAPIISLGPKGVTVKPARGPEE